MGKRYVFSSSNTTNPFPMMSYWTVIAGLIYFYFISEIFHNDYLILFCPAMYLFQSLTLEINVVRKALTVFTLVCTIISSFLFLATLIISSKWTAVFIGSVIYFYILYLLAQHYFQTYKPAI